MFEKNLEALDNLSLKRRLSRISPIESRVGISYCVTPSNDYVLLKNELPADDLNNPREAIRKFCDENIKHVLQKNDIIIGFGIGLGYILDELFSIDEVYEDTVIPEKGVDINPKEESFIEVTKKLDDE